MVMYEATQCYSQSLQNCIALHAFWYLRPLLERFHKRPDAFPMWGD